MTQLRTAWRRAVETVALADQHADPACPTLAELLAYVGPEAESSDWTCNEIECMGPLADELCRDGDAGPVAGPRLLELADGLTHVLSGTFEANRPGDERPWLALRAVAGTHFVVATQSRALLDELRRRYEVPPGEDC